jgi:hypothetical protein
MPQSATAGAPTNQAELEILLKDDNKVKVAGKSELQVTFHFLIWSRASADKARYGRGWSIERKDHVEIQVLVGCQVRGLWLLLGHLRVG